MTSVQIKENSANEVTAYKIKSNDRQRAMAKEAYPCSELDQSDMVDKSEQAKNRIKMSFEKRQKKLYVIDANHSGWSRKIVIL
jgi:hypothetical protein